MVAEPLQYSSDFGHSFKMKISEISLYFNGLRFHLSILPKSNYLPLCCYTGLRYSDFCQLTPENFIRVNGKRWLYFKSVKTGVEIRLPLHLLFESRALGILDRYPDIGSFAALPCNSEVNKQLRKLAGLCGIKKRITYHVSRHTCATLLVHQGVAITTVQKLLGHTSVKTTQIYSEVLSSTIVRDLKNVQRKKVKMFPDKGLRTSDFIDNR